MLLTSIAAGNLVLIEGAASSALAGHMLLAIFDRTLDAERTPLLEAAL